MRGRAQAVEVSPDRGLEVPVPCIAGLSRGQGPPSGVSKLFGSCLEQPGWSKIAAISECSTNMRGKVKQEQ